MASVETKGFLELTDEITKMADAFVDQGGSLTGSGGLSAILKAGAQPILEQAKINVPVRSGTLRDSLKIAMRKKGNRTKARIGAQRKGPGFYATFVEFGHKGPRPAGPHPFLAPAFDAKQEEAYEIIKAELTDQLK